MKENQRIVYANFYTEDRKSAPFDKRLKNGDVIKAIEFNTDTQVYEILVEEDDMEIRYYGSPETGYAASVGYRKDIQADGRDGQQS